MKQSLKNETGIMDLISKLQEQLTALDKKIDILVHRSLPQTKPAPQPPVHAAPSVKPHDHNKGREQHKAICTDCQKECTIPFKPSGDRPVYCQDCFSRRKVIRLSGIKVDEKPKETVPSLQTAANNTVNTPKPLAKKKKKPAAVKKPAAKKKTTPKKK